MLVADAMEVTEIVARWLVGYPQDKANERADVLSALSAFFFPIGSFSGKGGQICGRRDARVPDRLPHRRSSAGGSL